jgi:hypothetical protein
MFVLEMLQWLTLGGDAPYQLTRRITDTDLDSTTPLHTDLAAVPNGLDIKLVHLPYFGWRGHGMFTIERPSWLCMVSLLRGLCETIDAFTKECKAYKPIAQDHF